VIKLKSIFGEDLKSVSLVCDDTLWSSGEYYCFILCDNYKNYISGLKENAAFFNVVPNTDEPDLINDKEVEDFIDSIGIAGKQTELVMGDIVTIKQGYLKNLYGLILNRQKNKYNVSFRFCTKSFVARLAADCLQFVGNLFQSKKFPVTLENIDRGEVCQSEEIQKVLVKLDIKHKIHRRKNRRSIKAV